MRRANILAGAVVAGLLGIGEAAWSLDVGDVKQEWTAEGRKLAAERVDIELAKRQIHRRGSE